MTDPVIDLAFPIVQGLVVPIDHGHQLYGALKQAAPQLAEIHPLGIQTLRGTPLERGLLHLRHHERLRVRLPADRIAAALPLAGKELEIHGMRNTMRIRLGSPSVEVLEPHAELYARTVVVAKTVTKAERKDDQRGNRVITEAELIAHIQTRCNASATVRVLGWRTIHIHGKPDKPNIRGAQVKGAEMVIEGLDAEHSMKIQTEGIGGRRAFGCGIFVKAGVRKVVESTAATSAGKAPEHA